MEGSPTRGELRERTDGAVVLAIEASTRAGELALRTADGATQTRALDPGASHGRDLVPAAAALTRAAGLGPRDLDAVVVGRGPGSYTGLRVAAAVALGLMRGADAALVGVPSFEAIALAGLRAGERGAVLRDAFGGEVYGAVYARADDGTLDEIIAPFCAPIAGAGERVGEVDAALGETAILERVGHRLASVQRDVPRAAGALLVLGQARLAASRDIGPEAVKPLYLRAFEAKVRRRT